MRKRKEIMTDWTEEVRNWPGLSGILKRTVCWSGGQVRTSNAVPDASYAL